MARNMVAMLCFCLSTASSAQELLGVIHPGGRIDVTIGGAVSASYLSVLVDGKEIETGWEIVGGQLWLTLPEGLLGQKHDLVLRFDKPGQSEIIGA